MDGTSVMAIAIVVLNIIGIVWIGIVLEHPFFGFFGYIIILVIAGNINMYALGILIFIVAAITLIAIIVEIVNAIREMIWGIRRQKEQAQREAKQTQKNSDLLEAVNGGDKQTAQNLIENGADVNYIGYIINKSMLQIAVEKRDKEMVSLLIEKGADVNLVCDGKPLVDCAEDNEIIATLKSHGAKTQSEIEIAEAKRKKEWEKQDILNSYLFASINYHNKEEAEFWISQGANVNASSNISEEVSGVTPLLYAIMVDDIEMVKLLLKHGADAHREISVWYGVRSIKTTAYEYARYTSKKYDIANLLEYS